MTRTSLPMGARRVRALAGLSFIAVCGGALLGAPAAHAQWVPLTDETSGRMPTGAGLNNPATSTNDPMEKDYAWDDLDNDGDIDLVCVRKIPFTFFGGRPNVLFMNEDGRLIDRTATLANTSANVPASEIAAANAMPSYSEFTPYWSGSTQGFLDPTNDRDVVIADVNNDGWKDVITATTISDVNNSNQPYYLPRFLGHPRVYLNLGENKGVWLGLQYNYDAIPQLVSISSQPWHPRFCSLAVGDVTGDGYADLYFGDYDSAEVGPDEPAGKDMDNKLLINLGAANPGVFVDESVLRMGSIFNYPDSGPGNYLVAAFGAASVIADMNDDGHNDVVKQTGLTPPQHVAVVGNNPADVGMFNQYKIVTAQSPYFVSAGDLNNDGRLDLVITDDGADHYHLNQGNDGNGMANFSNAVFAFQNGDDDGFGSQSVIADLDGDGWKDVIISDVDVDGFGCGRRAHIYRNLGNGPSVTLREESPSIVPTNLLTGTHNTAVFDLNGDGFNDVVFGRCNTTHVWMNGGIAVTIPNGVPALVDPQNGASFDVSIAPVTGGVVVVGSARLHVSVDGGTFTDAPLAALGGSLYRADLPAGPCASLRFYISVQYGTGGTVTSTRTEPANAPATFFSTLRGEALNTVLENDVEGANTGWTLPALNPAIGAWEAAIPVGTINGGEQAAPSSDATPPPGVKAFVTGNGVPGGAAGASDVDGSTFFTSPIFDAAGGGQISFNYWFYSNFPTGDSLTVALSNTGGPPFTTVHTISATSGGWLGTSLSIGDYLTPTAQMIMRFTATDGGSANIVEAGIDDLVVQQVSCAAPCPADIVTAGSSAGVVDIDDLLAVISAWGACPTPPAPCPANIVTAGASATQVDIDDLLAVISAWGACP